MRGAEFREVWERLAAEVRAVVDDRQREMWAVAFHPPQDAPALGWMPSEREYVGAVDATPPVVERPDPVADLMRGWRWVAPPVRPILWDQLP